MNSKTPTVAKFIVAISFSAIAVFGFFSYEARNEIYYLCGNFKKGVSYSSVIRQLDTANLSGYKIQSSESDRRVVHSSPLHLHLLRCSIDFNPEKVVVSARYG